MQETHINFISKAITSLEKQFEDLGVKIIFDYNLKYENEDSEEALLNKDDAYILNDAILTLDIDAKTVCEYEANEIDNLTKCNDFVIQFLTESSSFLMEKLEGTNNYYNVFSTDEWQSTNSYNFIGVYNNNLLALLELQCHFREIMIEENGAYTNINNNYEQNSNFNYIRIDKVQLNTIEG